MAQSQLVPMSPPQYTLNTLLYKDYVVLVKDGLPLSRIAHPELASLLASQPDVPHDTDAMYGIKIYEGDPHVILTNRDRFVRIYPNQVVADLLAGLPILPGETGIWVLGGPNAGSMTLASIAGPAAGPSGPSETGRWDTSARGPPTARPSCG